MTESDLAKPRRVPERLCIACRTLKPRDGMIRMVRLPEGDVALDPTNKKHGRGAYVCRNQTCLAQAARRGSFARALRKAVPEELMQEVIALGSEMTTPH